MPSQPQDSEKLTDAVAKALGAKMTRILFKNGTKEPADGAIVQFDFADIDAAIEDLARTAIAEVSRHRTPSVPGEDMLKRARDWLDKNPGSWLTSATASLATELSLAREEERERCWQIAFNGNGSDPADCAHNIAKQIGRAIGKEG